MSKFIQYLHNPPKEEPHPEQEVSELNELTRMETVCTKEDIFDNKLMETKSEVES